MARNEAPASRRKPPAKQLLPTPVDTALRFYSTSPRRVRASHPPVSSLASMSVNKTCVFTRQSGQRQDYPKDEIFLYLLGGIVKNTPSRAKALGTRDTWKDNQAIKTKRPRIA
jgi:hypothetical protein